MSIEFITHLYDLKPQMSVKHVDIYVYCDFPTMACPYIKVEYK